MSKKSDWRRELAHGLDVDRSEVEERRQEVWNLICLNKPNDITADEVGAFWPDLQVGRIRADFWKVDRVKLKSISTSEHVQVTADLLRVGNGDRRDPNPLKRPLSWELDTTFEEVPAEFDADGKRLENTAGEPLTGLTDQEPILIFTGTRFVTRIPDWLDDFAEMCTNESEVILDGFVCKPDTLKMEGLRLSAIDVVEIDGKEIRYREMPLRLLYRKSTWRGKYLNQGFSEYFPEQRITFAGSTLSVTPERRVPCVDSTGKPVEKPVPLTKEGQRIRKPVNRQISNGSVVTEFVVNEKPDRKDLHTLDIRRLKPLDFNLLLT